LHWWRKRFPNIHGGKTKSVTRKKDCGVNKGRLFIILGKEKKFTRTFRGVGHVKKKRRNVVLLQKKEKETVLSLTLEWIWHYRHARETTI